MKRRSVTFTDSPPEVINDISVGAPLPTSNTLLWLQLAKFTDRQQHKQHALCTERKQPQQHSRSVPDLRKQQHYLSPRIATDPDVILRKNPGKGVFRRSLHMDPIYRSIPDLGLTARSRFSLSEEIELTSNGGAMNQDTSQSEHKQHHHCSSFWDYFRKKRHNISAADLYTKRNNADDGSDNDNGDDIRGLKKINYNYKNFDDRRDSKDVGYTTVNCVADIDNRSNDNDSDVDGGVRSGGMESEGFDRRRTTSRFLRCYLDYKKALAISTTATTATTMSSTNNNWYWRVGNNDRSSDCYSSLLNNYSRCHRPQLRSDGCGSMRNFLSTCDDFIPERGNEAGFSKSEQLFADGNNWPLHFYTLL